MAIPALSACALLVVLLLLASSADADTPFLIARKTATLSRLKSGAERVSVSIDLYNQGSATAYDVSLADDTWPQDTFDLVSGSHSNTWEKLDPGSIASHTFVLESKVKGLFQGSRALVTFRVPTRAALLEAYSTPILPLDILADKPREKIQDLAKRLIARYGSLVSVVLIVILFVYLVATPSKSGTKGSKKKR